MTLLYPLFRKRFALGRFEAQVEFKRFLETQPAFAKYLIDGEIANQRVTDMLTQLLYSDYLAAPKIGCAFTKSTA